jgi:hypothetical protein
MKENFGINNILSQPEISVLGNPEDELEFIIIKP